MGNRRNKTAEAILETGKREPLKYGYEQASLRRIAEETSVTTGATYGCLPGKEALFEVSTRDAVEELVNMYMKAHEDFAALASDEQSGMLSDITGEYVPRMVNFIYDYFDVFKLLMCYGAPGARDGFFDRLAAVEEKSCWDLVGTVKTLGHPVPEVSDTLIHTLCRSFFQQLHESVPHDVPREQAVSCLVTLSRFQHAGWIRVLGLQKALVSWPVVSFN